MINEIKLKYILNHILNYIQNKNFQLKLLMYSKYFQNKLNINKSKYYKIYLDSLKFNFNKYLTKEKFESITNEVHDESDSESDSESDYESFDESDSVEGFEYDDDKSDDESDGKSDGKSDDRSDKKSDDRSDDKSAHKSDDKSDDKSEDKSDHKSVHKSDDNSDSKSDDKSVHKSDDNSDSKSDNRDKGRSNDRANGKCKKDILSKEYNYFISRKGINEAKFEKILFEVLNNENEQNEEEYEKCIDIDSPLFEVISKTKNFGKLYTICIYQRFIDKYKLLNYY